MFSTKFSCWFDQIQQQAVTNKHRFLVVLAGEYSWSLSLLESVKNSFSLSTDKVNLHEKIAEKDNWLIYSDSTILTANVNKQNYRHKLGSESQVVVFADSEFNIDALAALSGTIVAGGVLFILFPDQLSIMKNNHKSAFLQRFIDKLEKSFSSFIVEQGQDDFNDPLVVDNSESDNQQSNQFGRMTANDSFPLNCANQEQYQAVQAIVKVVTGHRNRPFVLTADRGRGKSCALAIACANIIESVKFPQDIIITAPHVKALEHFFSQLQRSLPQAKHQVNRVIHENGKIEFLPVDQLLKHLPKATLLLVDEAAGIPVYLLTAMLQHYHRMVFSSTVHGYEGAGRGFTLKFKQVLTEQCPQWQQKHLTQPIRWHDGDPIEQFIFDVCFLNALLPDLGGIKTLINTREVQVKELSKEQLLTNEELLAQVFSVLITAHYQTTPSDLKLLLDNSQMSVLCLFYHQDVIAVALLIKEGHHNDNDILAVKNCQRRLRDQFLPQSLLTHCGVEEAFNYTYLRIMRIAVHPECQHGGIGSFFLAHITEYAKGRQVDFIGSSFGCNEQLLNFWLKSNYQLARIGFGQDAASGEHSALILKPLNQMAEALQSNIHQSFYQSFVYLLSDEYQQLPDNLVWLILHNCPKYYLPILSANDLNNVKAFANKERLYSSCAYSLHLWLLHQFFENFDQQLLPILSRLLKRQSVSEVCSHYQLTGKKTLNQLLISYVNKQLCR